MIQRFAKVFPLVAAIALTACGGPDSFEEISDVTGTSQEGDIFTVRTQISMVAESLVLAQVGGVAHEIAKGVQSGMEGPAADAKTLRVALHFDATDRLGNESSIYVGSIAFPMDDVRAANLPNLRGEMFLELANGFTAGEDASPIYKACADQDLDQMTDFCRMVAITVAGDGI